MPIRGPNVFTIPPGAPFLPTLARALISGALLPGFPDAGDPLALTSLQSCADASLVWLDGSAQEPALAVLQACCEGYAAYWQAVADHRPVEEVLADQKTCFARDKALGLALIWSDRACKAGWSVVRAACRSKRK